MRLPNPRNYSIPNPREMRIRETFQGPNGVLLASWLASSLLAIIVPLSTWLKKRNQYYGYYGKYNKYEQQQRQYEEQMNGNYYGNYGVCSWYDFRCRYRMAKYQQYAQQREQGQQAMFLPRWYTFFGGQFEGEDREREMGYQSNAAPKFVYICTVAMFFGLFYYGWRVFNTGQDHTGLIVALFLFGQFSLMNLITSVQGSIETDNRFFEESVYGWYGQWSVLIAYSDLWIMLHCFIFGLGLGITNWLDKKAEQEVVEESEMATHYQEHSMA